MSKTAVCSNVALRDLCCPWGHEHAHLCHTGAHTHVCPSATPLGPARPLSVCVPPSWPLPQAPWAPDAIADPTYPTWSPGACWMAWWDSQCDSMVCWRVCSMFMSVCPHGTLCELVCVYMYGTPCGHSSICVCALVRVMYVVARWYMSVCL